MNVAIRICYTIVIIALVCFEYILGSYWFWRFAARFLDLDSVTSDAGDGLQRR